MTVDGFSSHYFDFLGQKVKTMLKMMLQSQQYQCEPIATIIYAGGGVLQYQSLVSSDLTIHMSFGICHQRRIICERPHVDPRPNKVVRVTPSRLQEQ